MRTSAGEPKATPPRRRVRAETEWRKPETSRRLTEERDKLLNDTAARIARDIAEIGNQLETKIAAVTARILEPFISSAVQKKAVASFVEQLSSLTTDSSPSDPTNIRTIRSAGAGAEQARRPLDRSRTSCHPGR